MSKVINYEDIPIQKYINIDTIYKNGGFQQPDAMTVLMKVRNGGGFRPCKGKKYFVIHSTKSDVNWPDFLDQETGLYTYYGDNKDSGYELHSKMGNKFLKEIFDELSFGTREERLKIQPLFLFESNKENRGVQYKGMLVPGFKNLNEKEFLVAMWATKKNKERFQNYKAIFTLLDPSEGSINEPNDSRINLNWLDDIKNGKCYDSQYAPIAYKRWVDTGKYTPFESKIMNEVRSKEEQLPSDPIKKNMLNYIFRYFFNSNNKKDSTKFEAFALYILSLSDANILKLDNTRPTRDGGRDGIGEYRILSNVERPLTVFFSVEAKCYNENDSVGVKETSRLISRIKHRQFGVLVTTSFVAKQAYEEIVEDGHPISIISGGDIIEILYKNGYYSMEHIKELLENNFPKN